MANNVEGILNNYRLKAYPQEKVLSLVTIDASFILHYHVLFSCSSIYQVKTGLSKLNIKLIR
jgi:hypothetical protein